MTESEDNFEIIVGTYEEFLLGYRFKYIKKNSSLVQSFATHDHAASIRSVSAGGRYVASGSADDRICVYDMKARREQTVLTHHTGTINYVAFTPDGTHLLTGSEDGNLVAIRTGNWQIEKIWTKPHGATAIQTIAIHPTGKLALTLGNDNTLRTWNLVKGRQAYVVRLLPHMRSAHTVSWSPDEKSFVIFSTRFLEIWSIETGGCKYKSERKTQVTSATWINENHVCIGHETGQILIADNELNVLLETDAHKSRVKCLTTYQNKFVVSADSQGKIIVWKYKKNKLINCAEASAGCRVTSMCIVNPLNVKREKVIEEVVEEEKVPEEPVVRKKKANAFVVEEYEDDEVKKIKKKRSKEDKIFVKNKKKKKV